MTSPADAPEAWSSAEIPGEFPQVVRLIGVMHALRSGCPWDAEQTHRSLIRYLVEEACEVIDAIEDGEDADLIEELGDLLLQVLFHSEIAAEAGRFTIEDVAARIADKLIARHPYVFADADVPADLVASWEQRKAVEKARSSALDGIPSRLSALSRAHKVIVRARSHGLPIDELVYSSLRSSSPSLPSGELEQARLAAQASSDYNFRHHGPLADTYVGQSRHMTEVGVEPPTSPPERIGDEFLRLVTAAEAAGLDPEQEARDALRRLETRIRAAEAAAGG